MMATIERQRHTIASLNTTIEILYGIVRDKQSMLHDAWKDNDWLKKQLGIPTKSAPAKGIPAKGCLTVKLSPKFAKGGAR